MLSTLLVFGIFIMGMLNLSILVFNSGTVPTVHSKQVVWAALARILSWTKIATLLKIVSTVVDLIDIQRHQTCIICFLASLLKKILCLCGKPLFEFLQRPCTYKAVATISLECNCSNKFNSLDWHSPDFPIEHALMLLFPVLVHIWNSHMSCECFEHSTAWLDL